MRPWLFVVVAALILARWAWRPGMSVCARMSMAGCVGVAVVVEVGLCGLAFTGFR
jgi:hypothetical protein